MQDVNHDHKFLNGEFRLLIDSVLLTDGLPKNDRISLIRRIEGLSSKYFHSEISKIDMDIYDRIENKQIILTLEEIGSAIAEGTQVTFHYSDCSILMGNRISGVTVMGKKSSIPSIPIRSYPKTDIPI